ncbi:hypothetical protein RchiOBHm_Chr7g0241871 [Rosa chinensis]|uniref:Uncharacterized protein n=1 Tax=Rosa chinensis TaxID=74649 RepID=A0A2P6PIB3_ROSCH|nr:uncharacterized protein LOC112179633 [Rosa chinensis]PRQ21676.1 hypothetical protein RchiOBHm_Chr7g0241871 [Rosa chinensis]
MARYYFAIIDRRRPISSLTLWRGLGMLNPNRLRLRAFTGKHGFISLAAAKLRCSAWIDNSINTFITRALSSSSGDDDFSELGSPLPKAATSLPKLMTEKPEPYNKKANRRRKPSGVPLESSTSLKNDSSKLESVEASKRPFLADEVSVNCFDPSPLVDKEAVSIRIANINSETTDSAIHSMCTSYGCLEGLVRTKEDAVDAFFSVEDNADIDSIVAKLNDTVMNDHEWSAKLHHRDSTPAVMSKESNGNFNVGLHLSRQLAEVKRQVIMKTVCIEDLEYLHNALVHLEAHSCSRTSISKDD